jgi:GT2 family glycosyltransferase
MAEPRLTALMPVKEFHPEYLRRALASMAEQTSGHWRLLVIVEDSAPNGLAEALSAALEDERVALAVNEGRGLAGAINTGMRRARTEYTAILLGDDLWTPRAAEVLDAHIERSPDVAFFHSSRRIIDEDDRPISTVHAARTRFTLADFRQGSPVKHLLCWRCADGLAIGGLDESLNSIGPDDYDFPWSMAEAGYRFEAIPDCLYLYRDHRESFRLTTHLPRSTHIRELGRIFRKHGVGRLETARAQSRARSSYLRQCLYRSPADRWVKQRLRFDSRRGWRETYE